MLLTILLLQSLYFIEDLGGDDQSIASAISPLGAVCGTQSHPYWRAPIVSMQWGLPGIEIAQHGTGIGISDDLVVGQGSDYSPWAWTKQGQAIRLSPLQGAARGVNDRGVICGQAMVNGNDPHSLRAFYQTIGSPPVFFHKKSAAYDINNQNILCGSFIERGEFHALLWSPHAGVIDCGLGEFYAVSQGELYALTAVGRMGQYPLLWDNGTRTILSGGTGQAKAVNDKGAIVGSLGGQAVIWDTASSSPRLLSDYLILSYGEQWELSYASGINNKGEICGTGYHNKVLRAFRLKPI